MGEKSWLTITYTQSTHKIVFTGDQQTYKIMKELQKEQAEKYKWFYAYPGDWHLMKLTAELFKLILWDSGLKKCSIAVVKKMLYNGRTYVTC